MNLIPGARAHARVSRARSSSRCSRRTSASRRELARENRVPAPVTQLTADLFRVARGELGEVADHVEIVKMVEQWAGVEIA